MGKNLVLKVFAHAVSQSTKLVKFCRLVVSVYDNDQHADIRTNGELNLIKFMAFNSTKESIFFDIGANVGDWSAELLRASYKGALYPVDPLKRNLTMVTARLQPNNCQKVVTSELALSDYEGTAKFYTNVHLENSGHDSLSDMAEIGYHEKTDEIEVQVSSLDRLCGELGVTQIDFVKIDVEGHEFNVLKGAKNLLSKRAIKFIQLELGHAMRANRVYFHDVFVFLDEFNYVPFVIIPRGVRRLEFTPFLENRYSFVNLLFVRKDCIDMITDIIRR